MINFRKSLLTLLVPFVVGCGTPRVNYSPDVDIPYSEKTGFIDTYSHIDSLDARLMKISDDYLIDLVENARMYLLESRSLGDLCDYEGEVFSFRQRDIRLEDGATVNADFMEGNEIVEGSVLLFLNVDYSPLFNDNLDEKLTGYFDAEVFFSDGEFERVDIRERQSTVRLD